MCHRRKFNKLHLLFSYLQCLQFDLELLKALQLAADAVVDQLVELITQRLLQPLLVVQLSLQLLIGLYVGTNSEVCEVWWGGVGGMLGCYSR